MSRPRTAAWLLRLLSSALVVVCALPRLTAAAAPHWTQDQPGAQLQVSLLTFGPGTIYWERFGHNAIVINDAQSGEALSYNYGIFDFEEENFFLNFLRGRMSYRMAVNRRGDDVAMYAGEGRWVREQQLNLAPPQRLALQRFLQWNIQPENTRYRYEYFSANCSTKVRDALDQVLGGALRQQLSAPSRGYTFRLHADHLLAAQPIMMLPMDLGLGPYADRHLSFWDESFVPMIFMRHLEQVHVVDDSGASQPLVASDRLLSESTVGTETALLANFPLDMSLPAGLIGSAGGLLLLWLSGRRRGRLARRSFVLASCCLMLLFGLAGLALLGLWGWTEHVSAWRNENLLLLNPLCLLLLPALARAGRPQWKISRLARVTSILVAILATFSFCAKVLPWFVQNNTVWISLLLPLHVALFLVLSRARVRGPSIFRDANRLIERA